MQVVKNTQKKYCNRVMVTAIFGGLFCILAGFPSIGKGLILGSVFSVINFILLGELLPIILGRSKRKTLYFSFGSIFFRYILLAIPLITAIKYDQFNLVTTIIGLFMIQYMILLDHLYRLVTLFLVNRHGTVKPWEN